MDSLADLERFLDRFGFPIIVAFWLLYRDYRWLTQLAASETAHKEMLLHFTEAIERLDSNARALTLQCLRTCRHLANPGRHQPPNETEG